MKTDIDPADWIEPYNAEAEVVDLSVLDCKTSWGSVGASWNNHQTGVFADLGR